MHPKAVSEHLGHSSIAVTMDLYGHVCPDHEEVITTALYKTHQQAATNRQRTAESSLVSLG